MANSIKKLPKSVVAKIAAGQVVERPASVVKELIENSIDANANKIVVEVEKAGFKSIKVLDNGIGMSEKDLKKSFEPHTTSKISSSKDLSNIKTFGFRGEALASIVAVAKVELKSREKKQNGNIVSVRKGKIIDISPVGMPEGTIVTVESLFTDVPARKKYQKHPRTEIRHIIKTLSSFALANSDIGFELKHNGKSIIELPPKQPQKDRIEDVLGETTSNLMLRMSEKSPHISLFGYVGHPQIASKSRSKQFIFVNKREVKNDNLRKAIKNAYGSLLDAHSMPACVLFISLPIQSVDANVNPKKDQVEFVNEDEVLEYLNKNIQKTLIENNLTYKNSLSSIKGYAKETAWILKGEEAWSPRNIEEGDIQTMQLDSLYVLLSLGKNVVILDQHAAHERILYNQYKSSFVKNKFSSETVELKNARFIEFPIFEAQKLEDSLEMFGQLGFKIESFGSNRFKVTVVPKIFVGRNYFNFISELLDRDTFEDRLDRKTIETIAYIACRSAIKEGDLLSHKEIVNLYKKLVNEEDYTTCPHGRPTIIDITRNELDVMFKRK